jgi:hypothetical protein
MSRFRCPERRPSWKAISVEARRFRFSDRLEKAEGMITSAGLYAEKDEVKPPICLTLPSQDWKTRLISALPS